MQAQLEPLNRCDDVQPSSEGPQRRLLRGYLHKTSNGLCGIKGYASLITQTEAPDASAARWAQKIIHEVERMENVFRSVGDLSRTRIEATGGAMILTLDAALERASIAHPELRIETGYVPEAELLLPAADLGLILDELLANSAQAAAECRECVSVRISGIVGLEERVALVLQDDGPGIAPDLLAQAADPFVTTRDGRLGIGLTRIETLLDMYGLTWNLTSHPGRGVVVTLEVGVASSWKQAATTRKRKAGNV